MEYKSCKHLIQFLTTALRLSFCYFLLFTSRDSAVHLYMAVHIVFNSHKSCLNIQSKSMIQSECVGIVYEFIALLLSPDACGQVVSYLESTALYWLACPGEVHG